MNEAWLELSELFVSGDYQYKRKYSVLGEQPEEGVFDGTQGVWEDYEPKDWDTRLQKRLRMKKNLKVKLQSHLEFGELVAVGIMLEPHIATDFEIIPSGLFIQMRTEMDFDRWDDSQIKFNTAFFDKVRIYDPNITDDLSDNPFPKPGRPSKRGLIWQVYNELKDEKLILFEQPQLRAIKRIQDRIEREYPQQFGDKGGGFGKEAIRNVITKDFSTNSLKNNQL